MSATAVDPTLREQGFPAPAAPPPGHQPAGENKWVVPHYQQFNAFLNYLSRTYHWTHDEALRDSECNSEAMWRDPVISTAIRDRQRPVAQLDYQLEPRDPTDPAQKKLADDLTEILEDVPRFQQFRRCLLDALWWGRSGVQVVYAWKIVNGKKRMIVQDWSPIHGDSLVFKFDGQVGILVNNSLVNQPDVLRIEGRGGVAKFPPADAQQCLLVHEFEPMPASFYANEMAGSVHGSGYRGRLYWIWWLKHNLNRIMFDFLRKVGNGFFLCGYAAGNRHERDQMEEAMEEQGGSPVIYVPLDPARKLEETLMHIQTNLSGADFQLKLVMYLNDMIRQAVLGEVGTTRAMSTGLGSGQSDQHGMTADERVKYDAVDLETPMQKFVDVLAKYNAPGVPAPRFQHLADKRQPEEVITSVDKALSWGLTIPETWVQEQLGIPAPNEGDKILSMVQGQQGAGVLSNVPGGVPMAGAAGPVGPGGQPVAGGGQQDVAALANQIQPVPGSGTLPTQ